MPAVAHRASSQLAPALSALRKARRQTQCADQQAETAKAFET
jgi:hypothetical protein